MFYNSAWIEKTQTALTLPLLPPYFLVLHLVQFGHTIFAHLPSSVLQAKAFQCDAHTHLLWKSVMSEQSYNALHMFQKSLTDRSFCSFRHGTKSISCSLNYFSGSFFLLYFTYLIILGTFLFFYFVPFFVLYIKSELCLLSSSRLSSLSLLELLSHLSSSFLSLTFSGNLFPLG